MIASVALCPAWLAGVLLFGRALGEERGLPVPPVDAIVKAAGCSKSQAYEAAGKIAAALPALARAPGRPPKECSTPPSEAGAAVTRSVLDHVMAHPGCVDRGARRQQYSDEFRRFLLGLVHTHASLELEAFAQAARIPLGTLKDWIRNAPVSAGDDVPAASTPTSGACAGADTDTDMASVETLHIQTVLDAWERWQGSFLEFCEHVRRDLHLSFGRDLVRRILAVHGRRKPKRLASAARPDERALRGAFETFFAGAQWVGDSW